jgi:hypothetical protein
MGINSLLLHCVIQCIFFGFDQCLFLVEANSTKYENGVSSLSQLKWGKLSLNEFKDKNNDQCLIILWPYLLTYV